MVRLDGYIGEWKNHVVIGGGYAPIIYKLYLTNQELSIPPVGTRDIDSLVPRKIPEVSKSDLARHLREAGFQPTYKDYNTPPTQSYVKEIEGEEVEIEFLTDDSSRVDKEKNIEISGVIAQPLTYLKLSLSKNIPFTTFGGIEGLVVSPEAWVFHKGLTFVKRKYIFDILLSLKEEDSCTYIAQGSISLWFPTGSCCRLLTEFA